jgi:uncharacterized protein YkwD
MGCGSGSKNVKAEAIEDNTFFIPEDFIIHVKNKGDREKKRQFDPNKKIIVPEEQIEAPQKRNFNSSLTSQRKESFERNISPKITKPLASELVQSNNQQEEPLIKQTLNKSITDTRKTESFINNKVQHPRHEITSEHKSQEVSLYVTEASALQYQKIHENLIKEIFAYQNMCRQHPQYIATALKELLQTNTSLYPDEVLREAIEDMRARRPVKALVWDTKLFMACVDHVMDLGQKGIVSNEGSDGSTVYERVNKYKECKGMCGENIQIGSRDPKEIVLTMVIDKKSVDKVHRERLMEGRFTRGAVCLGRHSKFGVWTVFVYSE